jgi:hypothetical protein
MGVKMAPVTGSGSTPAWICWVANWIVLLIPIELVSSRRAWKWLEKGAEKRARIVLDPLRK